MPGVIIVARTGGITSGIAEPSVVTMVIVVGSAWPGWAAMIITVLSPSPVGSPRVSTGCPRTGCVTRVIAARVREPGLVDRCDHRRAMTSRKSGAVTTWITGGITELRGVTGASTMVTPNRVLPT